MGLKDFNAILVIYIPYFYWFWSELRIWIWSAISIYLINSKHAEIELPITHLLIRNVEKFWKNWEENLEITYYVPIFVFHKYMQVQLGSLRHQPPPRPPESPPRHNCADLPGFFGWVVMRGGWWCKLGTSAVFPPPSHTSSVTDAR